MPKLLPPPPGQTADVANVQTAIGTPSFSTTMQCLLTHDWMTRQAICDTTGLALGTVGKALTQLESFGFIKADTEPGERNGRRYGAVVTYRADSQRWNDAVRALGIWYNTRHGE